VYLRRSPETELSTKGIVGLCPDHATHSAENYLSWHQSGVPRATSLASVVIKLPMLKIEISQAISAIERLLCAAEPARCVDF
jgi:hypothetical protein